MEWATASSVMSGAVVRGGQATWSGDDRPPPAPSTLHVVSVATGNRGRHVGPGDRLERSNENGPLTCGPDALNDFHVSKLHSNL
jgi:hypothetical protein